MPAFRPDRYPINLTEVVAAGVAAAEAVVVAEAVAAEAEAVVAEAEETAAAVTSVGQY